jgi:hypothetical protein
MQEVIGSTPICSTHQTKGSSSVNTLLCYLIIVVIFG